jgi:hypothetical protein
MWTECLAILGEDGNISLMNFSKVVARKGNIMDMMKKTQDQISLLQEWAKKVETGPVNRTWPPNHQHKYSHLAPATLRGRSKKPEDLYPG